MDQQTKYRVAREIDGKASVGRRDKLGVAHGTGPRSKHAIRCDIPILDDLQGRDELLFKERSAPPVERQGRGGGNYRNVAFTFAKLAFQSPDCADDCRIDPVFCFQCIESTAMACECGAAFANALV